MSYIYLQYCYKKCEEHVGQSARANFVYWVADCEAILREQYSWEVKR